MSTFAQELKRMRESRGLTFSAFARELGMDDGTYYAVERGITSVRANSAKSLLHNNVLSQVERQVLKHYSQEKNTEIVVTEEDKIAYRRRKNEQYIREMELPKKG